MPAPVHGTERGVEMDYSTIRDDGALMNLAAKVVDPDRRNTLVVLSADRYGRPGFDPADIGDALAGTDVDVYWLPDPPAANRLAGLTDGVACMYNGAAAILHAGQGAIIVLDKGPTSPDYLIGRAMAHATFMRRPDPKPAPAADAGDRPDGRRLRAENKRLKGELKRLRAASSADVEDLYPLFDDPDDWLDLEIRLAWARLIPAEGKRANRLPARWTMTPGFAATIASSPRRAKTVEACARILLGLDARHPYRNGPNGSPNMIGDWGNPVWRTVVQQGMPDSWRIHWTRDGAGNVVFLAAGGHDALI